MRHAGVEHGDAWWEKVPRGAVCRAGKDAVAWHAVRGATHKTLWIWCFNHALHYTVGHLDASSRAEIVVLCDIT